MKIKTDNQRVFPVYEEDSLIIFIVEDIRDFFGLKELRQSVVRVKIISKHIFFLQFGIGAVYQSL